VQEKVSYGRKMLKKKEEKGGKRKKEEKGGKSPATVRRPTEKKTRP
jgi:hypothetical protein